MGKLTQFLLARISNSSEKDKFFLFDKRSYLAITTHIWNENSFYNFLMVFPANFMLVGDLARF